MSSNSEEDTSTNILNAFKKGRQEYDKTYNVMIDMLESHIFLSKKLDDISLLLKKTNPHCESCKSLIESIQEIIQKKLILDDDKSYDTTED